ncbi:hypothetical protein [Parvularcula dongshanensis]|uniref:Uncharacterized protein n=1 Tax=Parvularcula dongshanensis TaxID=1173995 RepID=A0A840I2K4_9PROT|nr:hypothetical protein [Parvularcula dongshanensis]MBB4658511.1 hypothetical protein [Parvularcula dongshanensis]
MTRGEGQHRLPPWFLAAAIFVPAILIAAPFVSDLFRYGAIFAPLAVATAVAMPVLVGWTRRKGSVVAVLSLLLMFSGSYGLLVKRDRDAMENFHDRRVLCAAIVELDARQCDRLHSPCLACPRQQTRN